MDDTPEILVVLSSLAKVSHLIIAAVLQLAFPLSFSPFSHSVCALLRESLQYNVRLGIDIVDSLQFQLLPCSCSE